MKKELQHSNTMDNDWDKFKLHFEQVHPQFFDKLSAICPALTVNELRQCAYIKMNLSIKEIAALLNVTDGAIKIARNRMKKKMGLSQNDSLGEFLHKIYIGN
jgi:DNA-binding NarL/FixJ family response regulator